jgi:hypothetical protein
MEDSMTLLMAGALSAGYAVIALFFARFWRETHDRLFGFFAVAFVLLAVQRISLALTVSGSDWTAMLYGIRLTAFLLILYAVVDKNRAPAAGAG